MEIEHDRGLSKVAYHLAGHALVAAEFQIDVYSLATVVIDGQPPGARITPMSQYASGSPNFMTFRESVEAYCQMLLAGSVAEMMLGIRSWKAKGHGVSWSRWRRRRIHQLFRDDNADADFVFATILGYSRCETHEALMKRFDALWRKTQALLRPEASWLKVEQLAGALLELDVMTGAEALEIVGRE